MNTVRTFSIFVILTILVTVTASSQAIGDYGSKATGDWGTTGANWIVCTSPGTWTGATDPAPGAPSQSTNVWIRSGHIVNLEASKSCLNLTIESTAQLIGNTTLPTGTIQAVRVYGPSATINGIFGSSAAPGTNASLEAAVGPNGKKLTISGSGTFGPARVRVYTDDDGDTVVFNMNATFRYTGATLTTGGIGLYPQTDNDVFTVNAGKTLTFVDYSSIAVSNNSGSAGASNLKINVAGTIDLSGANSSLTIEALTGKTVTMNIASGGSVTVGGGIFTSTVADGGTTALVVDGSMAAGGQIDFSNPSFTVTGTGSMSILSGANLMIGHAGGIAASGASGQIRTTSRSFATDANYSYVGTGAQVTGTGLPSTIGDLTVNNSAGVTMSDSATVNDTLFFTTGNLITSSNLISIATPASIVRTSGHVVGNLQRSFNTGAGVATRFDVGTGSTYAPVDVTFASISVAGGLIVSTTAGDHPNIGTSSIDASKSANRYWTITNGGITFTTYDAQFNFASSDLDAGAAPGVFIAERYNAGWSGLTEGSRHSTYTRITGATTFSDFAVGQQTGALPAPAFELTSTSVNMGSTGVGSSVSDSVYVRNIGNAILHITSILSDNTPKFTVTPANVDVAVADSAKVKVTFSPTGAGSVGANVSFTHDASGSPNNLTVSGTGTVAAPVKSNGTGGGLWTSGATWQGGIVPTNIDSVDIRGTDSVWVLADTVCRGISVQAGGKLGLYDTLLAQMATVKGTVTVHTDGRFEIPDTCRFENGSVYDHNRDAGNLPVAAWAVGSTFRETGAVTASPANGNQNFYNIVWDSPGQSSNLNLGWDSVAIGGTITIVNTGVSRWQMTAPAAGDSSWVVLNGNIVQTGGQFTSNGTSNANTKVLIDQYGSTTVTGGNFSVSRGSQGSGTGSTRWVMHSGDISLTNATTQNSNPTNARFVFSKAGTQIVTFGLGNTISAFPFEVTSGTTLDLGSSVVAGSGNVMVDAGATLQTALIGGVDAALPGSGTKTMSTASSYSFNGINPQVTGDLMPDTLANLTIINPVGVWLSDTILVNGTLSVANGDLTISGKTVTLGSTGSISETAGNTAIGTVYVTRTMVQGVDESFGGIGLTLNAADAAPGVTSVTRTTGVAQTGGPYSSILRSFDVTPATNSGLNARVDYFFDNSELNGEDANTLQLWKSTDAGSTWSFLASSVNAGLRRVRATSVPSFARFAASDVAHPLGAAGHLYSYQNNWNLVSLPLSVTDPRVSQLFPTAISHAYSYANVYQIEDSLFTGIGYWLKFAGAQGISLNGIDVVFDTVNVVTGWNLIGSVSDSVTVGSAQVQEIPPGIVTSHYFGYTGSYVSASLIAPGKAYWVKTNAPGKIVLNSGLTIQPRVAHAAEPLDGFSKFTVSDASGNRQELYIGKSPEEGRVDSYELPPVPPGSLFDARFASQRYVETYPAKNRFEQKYPLTVQAEKYPVTLEWNMTDPSKVVHLVGLSSGGRRELQGEGSITLDAQNPALAISVFDRSELPVEFSLGANYPNPFNPSTSFIVGVPRTAMVDIAIYDILGQRVRTLSHDQRDAGYYIMEWNGQTDDHQVAGTGVYFLRMTSESFVSARKILMMK